VTALALTLVASLAACNGTAGYGPGEPPGPGGHSGGSTGGGDDDADGGTVIGADGGIPNGVNGFACTVADVRKPGDCDRQALAGLTVHLEDLAGNVLAMTTTSSNGAFSFEHPAAQLVWVVVEDPDDTYHRGAQRVGIVNGQESKVTVPIITEAYYDSILAASGQAVAPANGLVFLRLLHDDVPVEGATIGELVGQPAFYDGPGDGSHFTMVLPTTTTGFAAWFDVMPQGAASVTYNVTVGTSVTQHVGYSYAGAVTFLSDVI
jgi:hypothetical protein